jgi:thiol-disulfide isomerase/thioredoxin/uncharacterized membrane protein YphA (DoxX/SURF4 family)
MQIALAALRIIVGAVFAVAGIAKLADLPGSRKSVTDFGLPKQLAGLFGIALPIAELAVAVALIPGYTAWYGAAGALGLLLIFIAGISFNLARGRKPDCHCFGQIHSAPVGWKTLARNGALVVAAAAIVYPGRGYPQPEIWGWMALASLLGLNVWLLFHLLQQNGRLLLRIEAIEAKLGIQAPAPPPAGLPVGSPAPDFSLEKIALKGLLDSKRPVLLIFVEPDCGPCKELMPEIRTWQSRHSKQLTVEVINETGSKRAVADAYQCAGTPGAVLVSADGTIGSALAMGAEQIKALLRQATLPPAAKKGDQAPQVKLRDLRGRTVDLKSFRGSMTVLLFWNPGCGFCREVLDRIKAWEIGLSGDSVKLLVVSAGSVEDNRAQGFRSRVVIDEGFAAGSTFGVGGTPSAVMVDREGRIGSDVAVGGEAVLKLLNGGR